MQSKPWKFVVIATIGFGFLASFFGFGPTLGIDLAGGTVLIYQLERPSGTKEPVSLDDTKSTAEILQKRLDTLGLKEMSIRPAGTDQIMIQLPGVSGASTERIKKVIASSGQLFFKIPVGGKVYGQTDPDGHIKRIQQEKSRGIYSPKEDRYDVALYQPKKDGKPVGKAFYVLLDNDDMVDGKHLTHAAESPAMTLQRTLDFELDAEGAEQLAKTSTAHVNEQMAIVLDGVIISAPNLKSKITEGRGIIEGDFTKEELGELITVLRSGALPAKPKLQSQDTIAPTLGEDSIRRGMNAIYLGLTAILIFMVVYYRFAGLIANLALVLNLIILLGVMSLFEGTLTLPGIAGIVLTMGMAVDANILINERIREEAGKGLPISEAVRAGYANAFSAIFDSNLTTILTAAILYSVGTGPIRGFAVTLAVGISASLFTALWVTRACFELAIAKGVFKEVRYLSLLSNPKIAFLKNRRPFVIAALLIANGGFLFFVARGTEKFGIDFNGGSAVQMHLATPQAKKDVEKRIHEHELVVDGKTYRPYADADVNILGKIEKDGSAATFQVLLSAHGKVAEVAAAAAREKAGAEAAGDDSGKIDHTSVAVGLEEALRKLFTKSLVPEAFSSATWSVKEIAVEEPDPADPQKTRTVMKKRRQLRLLAHFDATHAKSVTTDTLNDALAAGEELVQGATAAKVASAAVGVTSFAITTRPLEFNVLDDKVETQVRAAVSRKFGRELSEPFPFKTAIGSAVAENLKARGLMAILLSLTMMVVYLSFRFELKAGVAAAMCLFHDVFASLGFMMLLDVCGFEAKINLTTIAAFLTIVGYSINDTIVTFDRMRENMHLKKMDSSHPDYESVLNESINQVLSRTILTSVTVFVVLVILALAGVQSLEGFTMALLAGTVFGTVSSIYVATPLLLTARKTLTRFVLAEVGFMIVAGVAATAILG